MYMYMKQNIWSKGQLCVTHLCVLQQLITHVTCSMSYGFLGLICGKIAKWYIIRAFVGRSWVLFPLSTYLTLTFHENYLELVSVSCTILFRPLTQPRE